MRPNDSPEPEMKRRYCPFNINGLTPAKAIEILQTLRVEYGSKCTINIEAYVVYDGYNDGPYVTCQIEWKSPETADEIKTRVKRAKARIALDHRQDRLRYFELKKRFEIDGD